MKVSSEISKARENHRCCLITELLMVFSDGSTLSMWWEVLCSCETTFNWIIDWKRDRLNPNPQKSRLHSALLRKVPSFSTTFRAWAPPRSCLCGQKTSAINKLRCCSVCTHHSVVQKVYNIWFFPILFCKVDTVLTFESFPFQNSTGISMGELWICWISNNPEQIESWQCSMSAKKYVWYWNYYETSRCWSFIV